VESGIWSGGSSLREGARGISRKKRGKKKFGSGGGKTREGDLN